MILKSDNFAIFDPISKKMRIMPKEITDTFARLSYKDGYILVRLFGGSFTFYHLTRYHLLNVRYTHDEIKDLGYKMRWGDIIKKSPEDFAHLPNTYIYDKKVVQQCHRIISKLLEEKKQILPKEEYLEYRKKITQIYNARILAAYPNKNKIEK